MEAFETLGGSGFLPILIDMSRSLAFIKLHPLFFVLHRLQKKLRLLLAHLAFFLRLGLDRLRVLRRFLRLLIARGFQFAGRLFAWRRTGARARRTLGLR